MLSRGLRIHGPEPAKPFCRVFEVYNTEAIDHNLVMDIPFNNLDRDGVKLQRPLSKAAFLVTYLFRKEQLLQDPVAAVKGQGALTSPNLLHREFFFGARQEGMVADSERALLAKAMEPPASAEQDDSIHLMLTALHCHSVEEFMQRMDEAGHSFFPGANIPIGDPDRIAARINQQSERLGHLKKDYDFRQFLEETTLEQVLFESDKPAATPTSDTFKEHHNRVTRWYRPWKPTDVPFWIKPFPPEGLVVRVDSKDVSYHVYNREKDEMRHMLERDWNDLGQASAADDIPTRITEADVREWQLPGSALGMGLGLATLNAIHLHKTRETDLSRINHHVQNLIQQQLAEVSL
jgi:hypothetical protein